MLFYSCTLKIEMGVGTCWDPKFSCAWLLGSSGSDGDGGVLVHLVLAFAVLVLLLHVAIFIYSVFSKSHSL